MFKLQLAKPSAVVLVYEVLFGEGVRAQGPAERHILKVKVRSAVHPCLSMIATAHAFA